MLPIKPKRQRIDFSKNKHTIFFFMEEGDENAHFILSHLSRTSNEELFIRSLKRLDNMNIRGTQLQAWYIAMVNHTPSKVPDLILTAFIKLGRLEQEKLVKAVNDGMPKNYPHKAKLHLNIIE